MQFNDPIIFETDEYKIFKSSDYNYNFNKKTGYFERWGKNKEDDPLYGPAPEIADIEVTTSCTGLTYEGKDHLCKFCYKSNNPNGKNMSFETFKKMIDNFPTYRKRILHLKKEGYDKDIKMFINFEQDIKDITNKLPENIKVSYLEESDVPFLTQVAFGADSKAESNPDLWKMMDYCREKGIVPNITVAQISDEVADKLVSKCGAVAVSRYDNKDICYDSVQKLTDRGLDQTNIHCMISSETFDNAWETLQDRLTDPRLAKLKAIVFLSLKKKGRGKSFTPLSQDKFKQIVDFAMENNIGIGFDSCSAFKYLQSVKDHPNFKIFEMYSEPCESSAFSTYCNVDAKFFPCSFSEEGEFGEGIDVANCDDFIEDVWNHPRTIAFRKDLLETSNNNLKCRQCPLFEI